MIFVTVGSQLPFDRLTCAVDLWAAKHPNVELVVQQGDSAFEPKFCSRLGWIGQDEWWGLFNAADFVVSHAGMGTILKALDTGKPLIVMPRLFALGEVRNDHQLATAERFRSYPNIRVVTNADELVLAMDSPPVSVCSGVCSPNLNRLITEIRSFASEA